MASVKSKINVNNEIESSGKFESVKEYLPVAVFIVLLITLYPILTNFIKKDSKENIADKNKITLLEQANKIEENIDFDDDGLNDKTEFILGTDRYFADTDNDGFSDCDELKNGYHPLIISPNDQLNEDIYDFAKEVLFNNGNTEFSDLESLRLKLENQISNELCKNSLYNGPDNLSDREKVGKAVSAKNPCLCSKVSDRQHKNSCYYKIGGLTNNEALCNYILEGTPNAEKDKANCFHALMLVNLQEKYCYRIKEGKNQTGCVLMLSLKTKKYNLCGGIKNLDERDDCYYGVATFSKKIELCDKIRPNEKNNNSERESCKTMVRKSPFPKF